MPRKRPANGTVQLNVWISVEAKRYLGERFQQEGRHLNEQIEDYIRKEMAVHHGEIIEQHSLPVISELIDTKLRKAMAQLRADLREDMQLDILEAMKTSMRNSDNRLASLIVRAVRDAGIFPLASAPMIVKAEPYYKDRKIVRLANLPYHLVHQRQAPPVAPNASPGQPNATTQDQPIIVDADQDNKQGNDQYFLNE